MMTDTNTLTFKKIVFLIHPDRNHGLEDVGGKMNTAKLFRDDESTLYKLAVKWGVVEAPADFNHNETVTPAPSATEKAQEDFRAQKLKAYQDHIAKLAREKEAREAELKAQQEARRSRDNDVFRARVRNRIFQAGDRVYVRTLGRTVTVTRTTEKRIYFYNSEGKETFAAKKNVRFTRQF